MSLTRAAVDAPELVEGWVAGGPRPVMAAVEPLARLRSPIMEAPRFDRAPTPDERPGIEIPPLREFMGPSALAIVVAAPLFVLAGWQLALIAGVGATIVREVERRMPASYSFAAGFLPYRPDDGWPHGVREDDDVRWNWSSSHVTTGRDTA